MFKEIKSYYFLKNIKESKKIKNKLLDLLEEMPSSKYGGVTKTDWALPKNFNRPYVKYFADIIRPYMNTITKKLKLDNWVIHNMWFQQYEKNSYHKWHTHASVQFSSVYYLELPNKKTSTQFKNIVDNNVFSIDVEEGDLLLFPSCLLHRSPKNKSKKRKSIIAFNSSFIGKGEIL